MEIYNKKSKKKSSCVYSHWIHEIVNKGTVDNYSILKYPDIVKLEMFDTNQKTIEEKIIDRRFAESKIKESPNQYRIVEIDVKKQIQKDILKSRKLNNQSWLFFLIDFLNPKKLVSSSNRFTIIINKAAKNPIIQIMSMLVVFYSFLKIVELVFNIDIPYI